MPSASLFDLALAAANNRGPKFPAALVMPTLREAASAAAEILKDGRKSPLEAFAELSLVRIVADYMDPAEQGILRHSLARISLDEARIYRAMGATKGFPVSDRHEYYRRAAALLDVFLHQKGLAVNDRASVALDRIECILEHCDLLTWSIGKRGRTSSPEATNQFFELRDLIFSALKVVKDEQHLLSHQAKRCPLVQQRIAECSERSKAACPLTSAHSRALAINQNISLLNSGFYSDLAAVRRAVDACSGLYGTGRLLSSHYIGGNSQLGQFALAVVVEYISEKLGRQGSIQGVSIPYTKGKNKPVGDFDIIFQVSQKGNVFGLPPGIYIGEVKTALGTMRTFLGQEDRKKTYEQLREQEAERARLVGSGFPRKSEILLIELFPDETRRQHEIGELPTGMRHIVIRSPLKTLPATANNLLSISDRLKEVWINDPPTIEGVIDRLKGRGC